MGSLLKIDRNYNTIWQKKSWEIGVEFVWFIMKWDQCDDIVWSWFYSASQILCLLFSRSIMPLSEVNLPSHWNSLYAFSAYVLCHFLLLEYATILPVSPIVMSLDL